MDIKRRINEIETRAATVNVGVRDLCAHVGVSPSTWWRWQRPDANPRLRDMEKAFAAMEAYLSRRETEMLDRLAVIHPDAARAAVRKQEAGHV